MTNYKLKRHLKCPKQTIPVRDEILNTMRDQLENTGCSGDESMIDFVKKYKENPSQIFFWDGPISFKDFINKVENGEYVQF